MRTPSTTLKMAVFAPMPSARVMSVMAVNPGAWTIRRRVCLSHSMVAPTWRLLVLFRKSAVDPLTDSSRTELLGDGWWGGRAGWVGGSEDPPLLDDRLLSELWFRAVEGSRTTPASACRHRGWRPAPCRSTQFP